jgi:lipoyl(octanoyl) transferase
MLLESLSVNSRKPAMALGAYMLGSVDFDAALALQRRMVYQVGQESHQSVVILCEHPPLITVGRQGSRTHIRFEPEELAARRWRVKWVNRGGGVWLHVPGQFALYPILALDRWKYDLPTYLWRLQQVVAATLDDFGVATQIYPGHADVWSGGRPIARIGVAVRDWVSYFGAILNVNPDLRPFTRVRGPEPLDRPMTSLERERRGPLRASMVRERLLEHFASRFHFERTALFFDHHSLTQKAPSDAVAASP